MDVEGTAANPDEAGGDPACWAHLVCPECGRFVEEPSRRLCPRCGADLPASVVDDERAGAHLGDDGDASLRSRPVDEVQ